MRDTQHWYYSGEGCSFSAWACSAAGNVYRACMHTTQEGGCAMDKIIGGGICCQMYSWIRDANIMHLRCIM